MLRRSRRSAARASARPAAGSPSQASATAAPISAEAIASSTPEENTGSIVGRWFEEATLLRAAAAFERATPWHRMHPQP